MRKIRPLFMIIGFICLSVIVASIFFWNISTNKLEKTIEKIRTDWNIPGVAVAIVQYGKVRMSKGFGTRKRGKDSPVNEYTLFQIASLSKAFTAYTASMLVQEKALSWDDPIKKYYHDFALNDTKATNNCTMCDLLSHRSGLPGLSDNSWRLWWHTNRSTEELIERLAFVPLKNPLRSHFAYNNMGYVVAARALEEITGTSWTELLSGKVLSPLKMKNTFFEHTVLKSRDNVATAHLSFTQKPIPWDNWSALIPAGGLISCANDMTLWIQHCLSNDKAILNILHAQCPLEIEGFLPREDILLEKLFFHESLSKSYGLGWMMYSLDDIIIYLHTGLADGMQSVLAICPEHQTGVAILANQAPDMGVFCLLNSILDHVLNIPTKDWSKFCQELLTKQDAIIAEYRQEMEAGQLKSLPPSLPLERYQGTYNHPGYGEITVHLTNSHTLQLTLYTGETAILEHWQADQFQLTEMIAQPPLPWVISFQIDDDQANSLTFSDLGTFTK